MPCHPVIPLWDTRLCGSGEGAFCRKGIPHHSYEKEVDRCILAFEEARKGKTVAMICSGDAGVYGMSGLMLEIGVDYPEVEVEVIPGVTAATGGAAVLEHPDP